MTCRAWREPAPTATCCASRPPMHDLYELIHPSSRGAVRPAGAPARLLRDLGYEIGSGVMVGIPGQTYESLAERHRAVSRPRPRHDRHRPVHLASRHPAGRRRAPAEPLPDQVPNTELMTYKAVALTRLVCPQANIPSTTALATINRRPAANWACRAAPTSSCRTSRPASTGPSTRSTRPRPASTKPPTSAASACWAASNPSGGAWAPGREDAAAHPHLRRDRL